MGRVLLHRVFREAQLPHVPCARGSPLLSTKRRGYMGTEGEEGCHCCLMEPQNESNRETNRTAIKQVSVPLQRLRRAASVLVVAGAWGSEAGYAARSLQRAPPRVLSMHWLTPRLPSYTTPDGVRATHLVQGPERVRNEFVSASDMHGHERPFQPLHDLLRPAPDAMREQQLVADRNVVQLRVLNPLVQPV